MFQIECLAELPEKRWCSSFIFGGTNKWLQFTSEYENSIIFSVIIIYFPGFESTFQHCLVPKECKMTGQKKKEGTTAFSDAQSMEWRPELQRAATTPQPKCCKTFPPHSMLQLLLPHLFAKFSHKRQLRKIKLAFSGNGNWVIFSRKTLLFWTAGLRCVRSPFAWPLLLQQL